MSVVQIILLVTAEAGIGGERDRLWLGIARRRDRDHQLRRARGVSARTAPDVSVDRNLRCDTCRLNVALSGHGRRCEWRKQVRSVPHALIFGTRLRLTAGCNVKQGGDLTFSEEGATDQCLVMPVPCAITHGGRDVPGRDAARARVHELHGERFWLC